MSSQEQWADQHGDVWVLGPDGLMHTPETAPFPREHVEKKWGPLQLVTVPFSSLPSPEDLRAAMAALGCQVQDTRCRTHGGDSLLIHDGGRVACPAAWKEVMS